MKKTHGQLYFFLLINVFAVVCCVSAYAATADIGTLATVNQGASQAPATPPDVDTATGKSAPAAPPLSPVAAMLSSLVLSTVPGSGFELASASFASAESLRTEGKNIEAILAYLSLMDEYPSTSQARASDGRINHLMYLLQPAQMDALEVAFPAAEDIKNLQGLTMVGQFHYLRAKQLAPTDPQGAARHIQTLCDLAWRAFQQDLDDDYKKTILDEYLKAAEALGKAKDTRTALSAHAETLPWSFTRWLIEAEINGVEPPVTVVTTKKGLESIRKYYLLKGHAASGTETGIKYLTKCRDLAQTLLNEQPLDEPKFDLAHVYLEASDGIGPEAAANAVKTLETYLKSQPLSIMRWIVRYELADYLTRFGASAEQTVAGFKQYETMLAEADKGLVEPVVRDTGIEPEIRGLLACIWGHAFAGTNKLSEAAMFYDWVLDCCPKESHPGGSATYAKAMLFERQHQDDSAVCIEQYKQFVQDDPTTFYAPDALLRVAEILERKGDLEGALQTCNQVKHEYQGRSVSKNIDSRIDAIAAAIKSAK